MITLDDLLQLDRRDLGAMLGRGHDIPSQVLADREWHGVALGLPRLVEALTWKKFKKVFVSGPDGLTGYNEAVEQNPLSEQWITRKCRGHPVRYGRFSVRSADARMPRGWDRGLLIDYRPPARRWDPMRFVRDPLVAVNPDAHDLLLGVSVVGLGQLRIPTPTYFALIPGPSL